MPNTLKEPKSLFDFSDAFEGSPFDFGGAFDSTDIDSMPEKDPRKEKIRQLLEDSGMLSPDTSLIPRPQFGSEVPSSLAMAGVEGYEPPQSVMNKQGEPIDNPLEMFIQSFNEHFDSFGAVPGTGVGAALMSGASATADVLGSGLKSDTYERGQSALETTGELSANLGRSFARGGLSLAYLPEAIVRNPGGTAMAMVEMIPEQAALVWHALPKPGKMSKEDRAEQKEARRILYDDPMGPVFAVLLAGGLAKMGMAATRAMAENASKWRINRGFEKSLKLAEEVSQKGGTGSFDPLLHEGMKNLPRPEPLPQVAGLLPDYSQMGEMVTPKPQGRRVPPAAGLEQDFGVTARPSGEASLYFDSVDPVSKGIAPPGNFMQFLARLRYEAKKGHSETLSTEALPDPGLVTKASGIERGPYSLNPAGRLSPSEVLAAQENIKPPKYRPFRDKGDDFEGNSLSLEASGVPDLIDVPNVPSPDLVARVGRGIGKLTEWLKPQKSRVESPVSKALIDRLVLMHERRRPVLGNWAEDFRDLGILAQKETLGGAIKRKIGGIEKMDMGQFMELPGVREKFVQIGNHLKSLGAETVMPDGTVRPFELNESFLKTGPIRLKADVLKDIWEDVSGTVIAAERIAKGSGFERNSKYIENMIDNMKTDQMSMSPTTERAIAHLLGDNPQKVRYAKTRGQALKFLMEQSSENLFRRYGVERPRLAHYFPEEFFETNPVKVINQYLNEASKVVSEIEQFGPNRSGLNDALKEIQLKAPQEYDFMSDLSDMAMGVIDRTKKVPQATENLQRWYANTTYGIKIGGGFSPFLQVTQPLISFVPDAGVIRSARAAVNVMKPSERAFLRRSGLVGDTAFRRHFGYGGESRVWDYLPTTKFMDFANRVLDYTAAETGKLLAQDLYSVANKDVSKFSWRRSAMFNEQVRYARQKLSEDFGIDWKKPFGESEFIKATTEYAHKSQLHPDVFTEPKFFNMPSTRWLANLKRFMFKQAENSRKMTIGEFRRGNVLPALRLAAGGYFGGGVAVEAKDKLREYVTGKNVFREHEGFWVDLANRYATIGSLGMWSDFSRIQGETPEEKLKSIANNIEFGVLPVAASDVLRVGNLGAKALVNSIDPDKDAFGEFMKDATSIMGTYGYWVSGRMRSDEEESQKNKDVYSKELKEARRAYWERDYRKAKRIAREWDVHSRQYPIDGQLRTMDWHEISNPVFQKNFK